MGENESQRGGEGFWNRDITPVSLQKPHICSTWQKEEADGFWDTKWDAMQLEERLQKGEKKGKYYLSTHKRFKVGSMELRANGSLEHFAHLWSK